MSYYNIEELSMLDLAVFEMVRKLENRDHPKVPDWRALRLKVSKDVHKDDKWVVEAIPKHVYNATLKKMMKKHENALDLLK